VAGGLNGYPYARNSPLQFVDPQGAQGISIHLEKTDKEFGRIARSPVKFKDLPKKFGLPKDLEEVTKEAYKKQYEVGQEIPAVVVYGREDKEINRFEYREGPPLKDPPESRPMARINVEDIKENEILAIVFHTHGFGNPYPSGVEQPPEGPTRPQTAVNSMAVMPYDERLCGGRSGRLSMPRADVRATKDIPYWGDLDAFVKVGGNIMLIRSDRTFALVRTEEFDRLVEKLGKEKASEEIGRTYNSIYKEVLRKEKFVKAAEKATKEVARKYHLGFYEEKSQGGQVSTLEKVK